MVDSDERPKTNVLIEYYKQQFAEIYHLDTLDWRVALILFPTFGGFFGVLGYLYTISPTTNSLLSLGFGAFRAFSIFLIFLSLYGMWTVARGEVWLRIRTKLIMRNEEEMGVSKIWNSVVNEKSQWKGKIFRRFSLFLIYSVLFYLSVTVSWVNSVTEWNMLNLYGIGLTLLVSLSLIAIHWFWFDSTVKKPPHNAFPKKS